jgi:cytochrome c-type biogenesis protein CcmH/NrfG
VAAHNLLALIALGRGDQQAAVDHLGKALDVDPHDAESRAILESIEAQQAPLPPP